MAFIVKSGSYHLSNIHIYNGVINCVTSDLKVQAVKVNGEVIALRGALDAMLAHMSKNPFLIEKFQPETTTIMEVDLCHAPTAQ
jgi:hypothetical protein